MILMFLKEWVTSLNKETDHFINVSKKQSKLYIKNRNKQFNKDLKDFGMSYHSSSLINIPKFNDFKIYIENRSKEILDHMGYDLKEYQLKWTELWVQEFAKAGGGNHEGHVHQNNHISGFYFLKCSEKTSFPILVLGEMKLGCSIPVLSASCVLNFCMTMANAEYGSSTRIIDFTFSF